MSIKFRRIIYISFISTFVISALFLLPYSIGYRYDFKKNKLVRTGGLMVDSVPHNASIYLEKKPQKIYFGQMARAVKKIILNRELNEKTPVIFNLIPNEYLLEVRAEGYYPWKKQLPVQSMQTTFADEILLFLQNPKISGLAQGNITSASMSPDSKKIAYVIDSEGGKKIELFDLESEKNVPLYATSSEITGFEWSPSSKKILFAESKNGRDDYSVVNIEKPEEIICLNSFRLNGGTTAKFFLFENVRWDAENDTLLYAQNKNTAYKMDLFDQKITPLFKPSKELSDFMVEKDVIYYLENDGGDFYLKKQKIQEKNGTEILLELPHSSNYRFVTGQSAPKNFLTLAEEKNDNLFLIDSSVYDDEKAILLKAEAKDFQWAENGKKMLYYNDFELWVFYPEENKKELLSRYSSVIEKAAWYPEKDYIIFAFRDSVQAIEEDGRDERNVAELIKTDNVENIMLQKNNPVLYFNGDLGGSPGLYQIKIQ